MVLVTFFRFLSLLSRFLALLSLENSGIYENHFSHIPPYLYSTEYEHLHFLWGRNVDKIVFPGVLGLLRDHAELPLPPSSSTSSSTSTSPLLTTPPSTSSSTLAQNSTGSELENGKKQRQASAVSTVSIASEVTWVGGSSSTANGANGVGGKVGQLQGARSGEFVSVPCISEEEIEYVMELGQGRVLSEKDLRMASPHHHSHHHHQKGGGVDEKFSEATEDESHSHPPKNQNRLEIEGKPVHADADADANETRQPFLEHSFGGRTGPIVFPGRISETGVYNAQKKLRKRRGGGGGSGEVQDSWVREYTTAAGVGEHTTKTKSSVVPNGIIHAEPDHQHDSHHEDTNTTTTTTTTAAPSSPSPTLKPRTKKKKKASKKNRVPSSIGTGAVLGFVSEES
ncbi:hypothetical protein HK102_008352, partial [Quaeritorhiza haematococci]